MSVATNAMTSQNQMRSLRTQVWCETKLLEAPTQIDGILRSCTQLRRHVANSFSNEPLVRRCLAQGTPNIGDIVTICRVLTGFLLKAFKERGIYPASTTLDCTAWRRHVAENVKEELCLLISPSLVTYSACLLRALQEDGVSEGEVSSPIPSLTFSNKIFASFFMHNDGQVSYRELSDMACTLRRAVAQNQGADVDLSEFVQLT